ncbi:uncharacterized protein Tco025E_09654, partial [Trypanosoma conorhini]
EEEDTRSRRKQLRGLPTSTQDTQREDPHPPDAQARETGPQPPTARPFTQHRHTSFQLMVPHFKAQLPHAAPFTPQGKRKPGTAHFPSLYSSQCLSLSFITTEGGSSIHVNHKN